MAQLGQPVMSLVDSSERYLIAPLGQNVVRHFEVGNAVNCGSADRDRCRIDRGGQPPRTT